MTQSRASSKRGNVSFCPFCHEGFEDRAECPEHELTLLPIDELPRHLDRPLKQVTFFADPRLGRGAPLLGVTLVLLGFIVPFVRSSELEASALEVAIDGAGNLWFTPGAAIVLLWILWQRRSRDTMRAARAAVLGLALGGLLPLLYTCRRIGLMAELHGATAEWLGGLWLMLAGLLVAALGSFRFGSNC